MLFASRLARKCSQYLGLDNPRLSFKCAPETFADLIEREHIQPSPYLGRYKWVMLDRLDAVGWNKLRQLIQTSYEMVSAKVPGKKSKGKKGLAKRASRKRTGRA